MGIWPVRGTAPWRDQAGEAGEGLREGLGYLAGWL